MSEYLHGYDQEEQMRLDKQSEIIQQEVETILGLKNIEGTSLLDLGCGSGYTINRLSEKYPLVKFVGVDIGEKHIDYAKGCGIKDNCDFVVADITDDAFTEEKFDVILIKFVLIHLKDPVKILKNAKKRLKENGRIYIIDSHWSSFKIYPGNEEYFNFIDEFIRFWREMGLDPNIGINCQSILREAGFKNIEVSLIPLLLARHINKDFFEFSCANMTEIVVQDLYDKLLPVKDSFVHNYSLEHFSTYKDELLSNPESHILDIKFAVCAFNN